MSTRKKFHLAGGLTAGTGAALFLVVQAVADDSSPDFGLGAVAILAAAMVVIGVGLLLLGLQTKE